MISLSDHDDLIIFFSLFIIKGIDRIDQRSGTDGTYEFPTAQVKIDFYTAKHQL